MSLPDASPPNPPLALGIGVVGHRLNRIPEGARLWVEAEIGRVLAALSEEVAAASARHADSYGDAPPILTLVGSLAEGADRMAARAALANGYALDAPLPFDEAIYEEDFGSAESITEFRGLLARARSVLSLPGRRDAALSAYEEAGRTMLAQADLVLGVWDGGPSAGRGGTADVLARAADLGLPILHVDAIGRGPTRLLARGDGGVSPDDLESGLVARPYREALGEWIDLLVRPPSDPMERRALRSFLRERRRRVNLRPEFPLMLATLGIRKLVATDFSPRGPVDLADDGIGDRIHIARALPPKLSLLERGFGWADHVATAMGQAFRGAVITNFLFAAFSVIAATSSLFTYEPGHDEGLAHHKLPFVLTELLLIVLVMANTALGRRRAWHRRWLGAREVAERLRAAPTLRAVGLRSRASGATEASWAGWYCRALLRADALAPGRLDGTGMDAAALRLLAILRSQRDYNKTNAERMELLGRRLERLGETLFGLTILTAGGFAATTLMGIHIQTRLVFAVTALAAALPAMATAIYGIRLIGDFEGIAERAERTRAALSDIAARIEGGPPLDRSRFEIHALAVEATLLADVAHWRLAAQSRELAVPG